MRALLIILISVTLASSLKWSLDTAHAYTFKDYIEEFGRKFSTETEYFARKYIFEANLREIASINSNPKNTWKAGVNEFTDKYSTELNHLHGYNRPLAFLNHKSANFQRESKINVGDLPKSVDWRNHGVVNPVRNQAACGSCWAFATVATVESHVAIQTGNLLSFSEQQLVDCAPNTQHCGGTGGCNGSTQSLGMNYFRTKGMVSRSDYQYEAKDNTCRESTKTKVATIAGFHQLPTNDRDALMEALANRGPVAISVAATTWKSYSSGIYNGDCGAVVNHVVVAVGYGEDENGNKYWIVRNSWGEGWGEKGYIRLARENSNADVNCYIDNAPADGSGCDGGPDQITVCGICGMYMDSSYPLGGKLA